MPARRRYVVTLTAAERTQLRGIVQTGREQAFRRRRAHILLQVDAGPWGPGRGDVETAELLQLHPLTVGRARRAFARQGLAASLVPPALDHARRERTLDGIVDKGISWAEISGCGRIGGPAPRGAGPGTAGATVTGSVRSERPRVGGSAGGAGRGVRRTEAAGVWRARWRSAMRVPRRRRG